MSTRRKFLLGLLSSTAVAPLAQARTIPSIPLISFDDICRKNSEALETLSICRDKYYGWDRATQEYIKGTIDTLLQLVIEASDEDENK